MCRKNHTLVATWTNNGEKTITGCTSGQPIFIIHHIKANVEGELNLYIKAKSGTSTNSAYHHYMIGQQWGQGGVGGCDVFMCIPTSSSVVIEIIDMASQEEVLVYKT